MKTLKRIILAIIITATVFTSCKKSKKVGPLGANLPDVLNTIITPALLDTLKSHGTIINEGLTPPSTNGIFLLSPNYCLFDNSGAGLAGTDFANYKYKFSNQNNSQYTIRLDYTDVFDGGGDTGSDNSATYISGNNNYFTVFAQTQGNDDGITYTALDIFSGQIGSGGIIGLQFSHYLVSKGPDPNGYLEDANSLRIFEDQDGTSETQSEFSIIPKKVQTIKGGPIKLGSSATALHRNN